MSVCERVCVRRCCADAHTGVLCPDVTYKQTDLLYLFCVTSPRDVLEDFVFVCVVSLCIFLVVFVFGGMFRERGRLAPTHNWVLILFLCHCVTSPSMPRRLDDVRKKIQQKKRFFFLRERSMLFFHTADAYVNMEANVWRRFYTHSLITPLFNSLSTRWPFEVPVHKDGAVLYRYASHVHHI